MSYKTKIRKKIKIKTINKKYAVGITSDDIMTPLLKKLSTSIKIHIVKPLCSVSKLSTEFIGSRRELVANSVHTAEATQLDS